MGAQQLPEVAPAALKRELLGNLWYEEIRYHSPLPADLEPWYCYTLDTGHCILVGVHRRFSWDAGPDQWMVPCPVRYVLFADWETVGGYPVVQVPYDDELGLLVDDEEWCEYEDEYGSPGHGLPGTGLPGV